MMNDMMKMNGNLDDMGMNMSLNQMDVWHQVQSVVARVAKKHVAEINLAMPLDELFPLESRIEQWKALRKELNLATPNLEYSVHDQRWISAASLMCIAVPTAIIAFGCYLASTMGVSVFVAAVILSLLCNIALIAVRLALLRSVWELRRTGFPFKIQTLKELCRRVRDINAHRLIGRGVSQDLDEGLRIWASLKEALVDALGVDDCEIIMQARLIRDLGAE